ncbi:hypothetical protein B0I12_002584 [Microbacterium hydrothermale]|uniref:hypothetical protein n=1 Tax=Microbacterium hydrothermale TaxID=857427 RepID=UPI00222753D0|nr:hypothetical protein [Microbacterium hydrothermale]MCW2165429.1 hypothetical protein [Microbacterium hydrothermale]
MAKHLTVPPRAIELLQSFARIPEDRHRELRAELLDHEPFTSPDGLAHVVNEALGEEFGVEQAKKLVSEIFSMTHLIIAHDYLSETAASDVAQYAELQLDSDERTRLAESIELLLNAQAVRGLAAGAAVFGAQDRLYADANVFVDVRPVFYPGDEHALGMVMVRRLRLEYYEDGDFKGLEVSFTESEYADLIGALEKGRREALMTEKVLSDSRISLFNFDEKED